MKIAPSILSADFANLEKSCNTVINAGADMLHIDVMDGIFVPNISIGLPVVKSLRKVTDTFFDVHLMIIKPHLYAGEFCKQGADLVSFHIESESDINVTIDIIKSYNKKVGLVVKPNTDIADVFPFLEKIDLVLIMSVEPGFGGQEFMYSALDKITALKEELSKRNIDNMMIQVDGGINSQTAKLCREKGANVLVAGSYVFNHNNPKEAIDNLKLERE